MLLYFKVSNSRSFDEEVEFSMIASDYGDLLPENTYYLKKYNIHVLKSAVIYGANASGKSNLLTAMDNAKFIILELFGEYSKEYYKPFFRFNRHNLKNSEHPTTYKFGFYLNDNHYEYYFSNTEERIFEEKLTEFQPNMEIIHFHRKYDIQTNDYKWDSFSEIFKPNSDPIKLFTKKERLFLSVANQLPDENKIHLVTDICVWFRHKFSNYALVTHDNDIDFMEKQEAFRLMKHKSQRKWFLNHFQETDFIIKDVNIEEVVDEDNNEQLLAFTLHEGIDKAGNSAKIPFDFDEESTGTQAFTRWLFVLKEAIKGNYILILDEFHNSLHLHLTEYLIKLFHRQSKQAQLIFATHDVKLMQSKLFRPDQIWLVKRDKNGNSQLDPLSNYKIDENYALDNMYLEGFYGGIPNIQK